MMLAAPISALALLQLVVLLLLLCSFLGLSASTMGVLGTGVTFSVDPAAANPLTPRSSSDRLVRRESRPSAAGRLEGVSEAGAAILVEGAATDLPKQQSSRDQRIRRQTRSAAEIREGTGLDDEEPHNASSLADDEFGSKARDDDAIAFGAANNLTLVVGSAGGSCAAWDQDCTKQKCCTDTRQRCYTWPKVGKALYACKAKKKKKCNQTKHPGCLTAVSKWGGSKCVASKGKCAATWNCCSTKQACWMLPSVSTATQCLTIRTEVIKH